MTTTLETPTTDKPTPPRRGRAPVWTGGVIGALVLLGTAWNLVGLAMWADADHATTSATATYPARPVVELVADGEIDVRTGGDDVVVERTARAALTSVHYAVDETADRLTVKHECSWYGSCRASLAVSVPAGTEVVVHASDGDVTAQGLSGSLDIRTGDGRTEVTDLVGDLTLASSDGAVDVRSVQGDVAVRSNDGSTSVDDVSGSLTATSGDGRVTVSGVVGDVDVSSNDGDVTVYGTGDPVALDIQVNDGRQTVDAPTDPGATRTVRIHVNDGDASYLGPR
ncbi:DUF4097 family beta strand repeat-containing protein [Cellulomonas rhizosphaerae]|uniref:DUF4097 domain-containing protein n=1 Tax=Cellulomonas rhizosphaerae TaxID=2293719 RepID=A0A413RN08_9CELL|nr:DUF4097 family beta strand repeat-containing protein [Cellulomonas rhizosphaerae]RHA43082.1 hypothetical protein D1825_06530 [Cellulomonas rhizosphaerae]